MPSYKLIYFNFEAKGEPIRLMLSYMGEKFVDERHERKNWDQLKPKTPFGKLPLLEVDGKVLNQSIAITRYLGKLSGLAGKNEWEDLQIDMAVDTIEDLVVVGIPYFYETNPEAKAKQRETFILQTIPSYLAKLDDQIKRNNGYLANGRLSWGDIYFYGLSSFLNNISEMNIFDKYPNIKVMRDNILANPNIKAWVDKRPPSDT